LVFSTAAIFQPFSLWFLRATSCIVVPMEQGAGEKQSEKSEKGQELEIPNKLFNFVALWIAIF
jgi:hypothetical protein